MWQRVLAQSQGPTAWNLHCIPVAATQVIRDLLAPDKYVIVVEHDLSVLDYLSDFICCLYGKPGAYGVVTLPFSVREGINIFLAGFVPTENLRFREESLTFKVAENAGEGDDDVKKFARYTYPAMSKTQVRGGLDCACTSPMHCEMAKRHLHTCQHFGVASSDTQVLPNACTPAVQTS